MRRRATLSLLVLVTSLSTVGCAGTYDGANASSQTSVSASVGVHFDNLSAYGRWIDTDTYGTAWVPIVAAGWRPYTVGYWAYTDWGWMWVSSDPWGWVPYRYGQWGYDASYGWVWVPGDVWAPAWVAWRYGDDWVGWAPLPPDVGWNGRVAFSYSSYDFDSRVEPARWCFAPTRALTTTRLTTQIVPPGRNVTLLSVTRNVTNYSVVNSHPVERGLRPELIERNTGRRVSRYKVVETTASRGSSGVAFRGSTVQVTRPSNEDVQAAKGRYRRMASDRAVSPPPRSLYQRQEAEAQRLEQQMQRERAELQRQQAQELRHPPRGVSRDELRRRHDAELRAQERNEQREREAVKQRREMMKAQAEERETQQDSKEKQQRGRNHGKGRPDRS